MVRPLVFAIPEHLRESAAGDQGIRGVAYAYFESNRIADVALGTLDRMRPTSSGRIPAFALRVPGRRRDRFALKLSAWLEAPAEGEYTFFTASDDGSRLYIDGREIVDNDGVHGTAEKSGSVALAAGRHEIVVTYFDNGGEDRLEVSWEGPEFDKQRIPSARLTPRDRGELKQTAIEALGFIPGYEVESFRDFATLLRDPESQTAAIRSMLRIPRDRWPGDESRDLAPQVLALAAATPPQLRSTSAFEWTVELGQELANALPENEADRLRSSLSDLAPVVIRIRSVPGKMLFDKKEFSVVAGKPVRIVFENPDMMPHNLLIVLPGAVEEIGRAAESMGMRGERLQFRPSSNKILQATNLISYGESVTLDFVAPEEPGDYGFLCTYPTHWLTMNGIMRVVPAR